MQDTDSLLWVWVHVWAAWAVWWVGGRKGGSVGSRSGMQVGRWG